MIKKTLIRLMLGFSIIMLPACNQNANEMGGSASRGDVVERPDDLGGTEDNFQRVGFQDTENNKNKRSANKNRNLNFNNKNNTKNNENSRTMIVPTDGIQRVGNGFLTIEQNSYRTTTPSKKFPHSKYIKRGQYSFYKEAERGDDQKNKKQQANGQQGTAGNQKQNAPQKAPENNEAKKNTEQGITAVESKVIELTNQQRRKNGLKDLQADTALSNVARTKSNDMRSENYFSHTSPTYGSPFDMMRDFGVSYSSAGENIAKGQTTPEQVVDSWMNSEGHRKNILSNDYTHIGVGYVENGNYWTQMFIKK